MGEYAADRRRGYFASFPDMGSYLGFTARSVLVSILQLRLGASATGGSTAGESLARPALTRRGV
ncbi:hypothetical protein ACVWWH_003631 [Sinomonas sp. RB5]